MQGPSTGSRTRPPITFFFDRLLREVLYLSFITLAEALLLDIPREIGRFDEK
jgi:hypothetical protein